MTQLETATNKQLAATVRSKIAASIHEQTQWLPYLEEIAKRLDDLPDLPEPSRSSHYS